MASPINSGTMMSNPCPSTFLDKNRIIAAELNITNNEKKYSPGSNFAKWMLQEIKRLIANIMSGSRSVNTEILNYFHPMPGTENNGNRTWMAATGENEYTVIEQTGGKSFKVIQFDAGEKNTKKIVKLLNEFTNKSQFILITHNKETMKGSHRLYGVTMNKEIGESRIVSVDI